MTNSERITAHNARLAAMKETVAGLPDAGGGGGAVETCTVTFKNNDTFNYYVFCPTLTGGRLEYMNYEGEYVVTDVPCKTVAAIFGSIAEWVNDQPAGVTYNQEVAKICNYGAWAIEIDVDAGANVLIAFE